MTDVSRLSWLMYDPVLFEQERRRIIDEHLASIPHEHRDAAARLQARVDDARNRLPREKFLEWMAYEMVELEKNLDDQLARLKAVRTDLAAREDPEPPHEVP